MFDTLSIVKTPAAARKLFPAALWKVRTREKKVYLTFDDGPIEDVTPAILDELNKYNAKATFFCIGKNIAANPGIFQRISAEGHTIGNHTQDHLNGWQTKNEIYYRSIEKCAENLMKKEIKFPGFNNRNPFLISAISLSSASSMKFKAPNLKFFRPPYGKLTLTQYNYLKKFYKIVMWDVLAFDFDLKVTKEQVLDNVLKNTAPGSIVVFHDSLKAKEKVLYALPKVLEHYSSLGYRFESLVG